MFLGFDGVVCVIFKCVDDEPTRNGEASVITISIYGSNGYL